MYKIRPWAKSLDIFQVIGREKRIDWKAPDKPNISDKIWRALVHFSSSFSNDWFTKNGANSWGFSHLSYNAHSSWPSYSKQFHLKAFAWISDNKRRKSISQMQKHLRWKTLQTIFLNSFLEKNEENSWKRSRLLFWWSLCSWISVCDSYWPVREQILFKNVDSINHESLRFAIIT